MRKSPLFLSALSVLAVLAGCTSQSGDYETITSADVDEEVDLTEIAYDFRIHPLKCEGPLDGIGGVKSWDDGGVMLARTNDSRKILRFDNYTLTAVLDRLGRGPGEYYFIEDFTYDKVNNCIYIENDSNLVTYDATTMEFKGKQRVNISLQNCLNVGDKMLYYGYYLGENGFREDGDSITVPFESMILVDRDERDLRKGTVLYQESGLQRLFMGYPELFYVNPKNYATCLTGFVNRIVTFNDLKKVTEVYSFKVGTDAIPADVEAILEAKKIGKDDFNSTISKFVEALNGFNVFVTNVYNIMVDGETISFRVTYSAKNGAMGTPSEYLYFVRKDNQTKVYKHLRIPGLSRDIDPTGANGNHQIAIIENLGDLAIDKSVPMSPLAQQIIDELKKQNDDNPVMLEFRFK